MNRQDIIDYLAWFSLAITGIWFVLRISGYI